MNNKQSMQNGWSLRLARPLVFLLGAGFSLLAVYSYAATAILVSRKPALDLPDDDVWSAAQLQSAQAAFAARPGFRPGCRLRVYLERYRHISWYQDQIRL